MLTSSLKSIWHIVSYCISRVWSKYYLGLGESHFTACVTPHTISCTHTTTSTCNVCQSLSGSSTHTHSVCIKWNVVHWKHLYNICYVHIFVCVPYKISNIGMIVCSLTVVIYTVDHMHYWQCVDKLGLQKQGTWHIWMQGSILGVQHIFSCNIW